MSPLGTSKLVILGIFLGHLFGTLPGSFFDVFVLSQVVSSELPQLTFRSCPLLRAAACCCLSPLVAACRCASQLPVAACCFLLPLVAACRRLLPLAAARRSCRLLRAASCCRFSPLVTACRCASQLPVAACCLLLPLVAACCRLLPLAAARRNCRLLRVVSCCRLLLLVAACRCVVASCQRYTQSPRHASGCFEASLTSSPFPFHAERDFQNMLQTRTRV